MVERGPDQNGVKTWRPVILGAEGREVFRDDEVYRTRHAVGITWLSGHDQLWILSGDVGIARIDPRPDGSWVQRWPKKEEPLPAEIDKLGGR